MYLYLSNNKEAVNIHCHVLDIVIIFLGHIFHCINILLNKKHPYCCIISADSADFTVTVLPQNTTQWHVSWQLLLSDQRFHHEAVRRRVVLFTFKYLALIKTSRHIQMPEPIGPGFLYAFKQRNCHFVFHAQRHRHSPRPTHILPRSPPMKSDVASVIFTPSGSLLHIIRSMQGTFKTDSSAGRRREKLQHSRRASYRFFQGSYCLPSLTCVADALNAKTKPASASRNLFMIYFLIYTYRC